MSERLIIMMPKTCKKDPTASGTAGPYSSNSFPVMIPEKSMKNTAHHHLGQRDFVMDWTANGCDVEYLGEPGSRQSPTACILRVDASRSSPGKFQHSSPNRKRQTDTPSRLRQSTTLLCRPLENHLVEKVQGWLVPWEPSCPLHLAGTKCPSFPRCLSTPSLNVSRLQQKEKDEWQSGIYRLE